MKKNLPLAYFTNVRPLAGANSEPLLDTADDETLANSCQSEKRRERYQSPNHTDSPPRGADERDVEVWQRKKTTFNVIYLTRKKKNRCTAKTERGSGKRKEWQSFCSMLPNE